MPTPSNFTDLRSADIDKHLDLSKRKGRVPVVKAFVRPGPKHVTTPLAELVRRQDRSLLDLYLLTLVRAVSPRRPGEVISVGPYAAGVWARMVGFDDGKVSSVSRVLRRGQEQWPHLLTRSSGPAGITVFPCREEGDGKPYERSGGAGRPYLQLPLEYWRDDWDRLLTLPAKAMLLVLLSREDWSELNLEHVPERYALKRDTAERGLHELKRLDLLEQRIEDRPRPLTVSGFQRIVRYRLRPPFGPLSERPAAGGVELTIVRDTTPKATRGGPA